MTASTEAGFVGDLSLREFGARLDECGVGVRIGCFTAHIRTDVGRLSEPLRQLYRDHPVVADDDLYSFHLRLASIRRPFRPARVRLIVDGRVPHEDLPAYQALAVLEWGMNLVIALRMHAFLMLHSAALERNGGLLLLPAAPGHGKTTLCTGLAHRGWRLFSDEFAMCRLGGTSFLPLPRPMPLKNESIDVIRAFAPEAELGPVIPNTRKGTIAHVKPPVESIRGAERRASPRWIVFPRWKARHPLALDPLSKSEAFMLLATNAFNYETIGEAAFIALRDAIDSSRCFTLTYSDLGEAVEALTAIADEQVDAP